MNKKLNFFENIKVQLLKDIKVDGTFSPLSPELFEPTGVFEESSRGDYEVFKVKKGSFVYVSLMPNNMWAMTDSVNSICTHASLKEKDFKMIEAVILPTKKTFKNGLWK